MAFWPGVELGVCFPFSMVGLELGQVLCILSQYPGVPMCMSPVLLGNHNFLGIFYTIWFFKYVHRLFSVVSWAFRADLWQRNHIRLKCPIEVSLVFQSLVLYLFQWPSKPLIIDISNIVPITFLILWSKTQAPKVTVEILTYHNFYTHYISLEHVNEIGMKAFYQNVPNRPTKFFNVYSVWRWYFIS